MFIKRHFFLRLFFYFYNCELQIKVETFKNQKKEKKVTFSDFYCMSNTKFWITNEIMFIKKLFLAMSIASFLQL